MPAQIAFSMLRSHIVLAILHMYNKNNNNNNNNNNKKKSISLEHADTHNSKL